MKKSLILFFVIFLIFSCAPKKEITKIAEVEKVEEVVEDMTSSTSKNYTLSKGTIHWTGTKIAYDHKGTVNIKVGTLSAKGNEIISGDFIIDMASIKNIDLPKDQQGNLEGHLKSADFFDITKFPNASFSITSVKPVEMDEANYTITGNLTMLGISKEVAFPALVLAKDDGTLVAISDKFTIDRTDWEIKYASSKLGTNSDKAIDDDITLQIEITAK